MANIARALKAELHISKAQTPWDCLREWELVDKGRRENTNAYITEQLQTRWPGNYRVERIGSGHVGWPVRHAIVFDDPAEETLFRLRWS